MCSMPAWPKTAGMRPLPITDRKSTRLNSSHTVISYAVFCLKKKREPLLERLDVLLGRGHTPIADLGGLLEITAARRLPSLRPQLLALRCFRLDVLHGILRAFPFVAFLFTLLSQSIRFLAAYSCAQLLRFPLVAIRSRSPAARQPLRSNLSPCPAVTGLFFFNDTASPEIYTLSLHDALPI